MNSNHESQIRALEDAKEILRNKDIATYSVLLKMTADTARQGTAEAIRCVLDTRKFGSASTAKAHEQKAAELLEPVATEYGLSIEMASTGHAYVTEEFVPATPTKWQVARRKISALLSIFKRKPAA